jgi:hypothetical protein
VQFLIMVSNYVTEISMKMLKYYNEVGVFKSDDVWFPTYYTYNILWNFTDQSIELSRVSENGILHSLIHIKSSNILQELTKKGLVSHIALNVNHKPYLENSSSKVCSL